MSLSKSTIVATTITTVTLLVTQASLATSCFEVSRAAESMSAGDPTRDIFTAKLVGFTPGEPHSSAKVQVLESYKGNLKRGQQIEVRLMWNQADQFSRSKPNLFFTSPYKYQSMSTDYFVGLCTRSGRVDKPEVAPELEWLTRNQSKK